MLPGCSDAGMVRLDRLELEGREAQQLASIARDCGIDGLEKGQPPIASGGGSYECESKVSTQGRSCNPARSVVYQRGIYLVPEGICGSPQ